MKTIEFETELKSDGPLVVPKALRSGISGTKVKVTLSCSEEDHTKPPEHYTKGYDQKDSLYDKY